MLPQHDASYAPLDEISLLRKMTFPFAHPEQCSMLLTRADTFYYTGSPLLRDQASQLYGRIIDRLSFLPLADADPLKVAYGQIPAGVMPVDSVDTLAQIVASARSQLSHIASGLVSLPICCPAPF